MLNNLPQCPHSACPGLLACLTTPRLPPRTALVEASCVSLLTGLVAARESSAFSSYSHTHNQLRPCGHSRCTWNYHPRTHIAAGPGAQEGPPSLRGCAHMSYLCVVWGYFFLLWGHRKPRPQPAVAPMSGSVFTGAFSSSLELDSLVQIPAVVLTSYNFGQVSITPGLSFLTCEMGIIIQPVDR